MEPVEYEKIKPGHSAWRLIQTARDNGIWACDSVDHNDDNGCSNPDCFKYKGKK